MTSCGEDILDSIVQLCSDSWSHYSGKIIQESIPSFSPRSHHEVFLPQHSQVIFLVAVTWWNRLAFMYRGEERKDTHVAV